MNNENTPHGSIELDKQQPHVKQTKAQIFIITGYSGAGKSTVLRTLEDLGFYCIDNLPIELLVSFFQFVRQPQMQTQKIALGMDARVGHTQSLVEQLVAAGEHEHYSLRILFLTASSLVLMKRFQETRRKHPLANPLDLPDAIEHEKQLLMPLSNIAHQVIDTDQFTIHELRAFVRKYIVLDNKQKMMVSLTSFGFKYGVPQESNFIYDVRSLPNPYFIPELKPLDGTNAAIHEYLFSRPEVEEYWLRLQPFFLYSLERCYVEGRFFLHVAIGCTGGRHRSVAFVQELARQQLDNVQFLVKHRDIAKDLNT